MNKAKPNSNSINNSVSNIWDPLVIFWAPPRGFSGSALCSTHSCLRSSGRLHSTAAAALSGCPMALASPNCWGLLLQIASPGLSSWCQASTSLCDPFIHRASAAIEASPGLSQRQASAALRDPFMSSKPVPPGRLLSAKFGYQPKVQPWSPLDQSFWWWLSGNTSQISPQWCRSLLNHR